jgi:hypothetical protein
VLRPLPTILSTLLDSAIVALVTSSCNLLVNVSILLLMLSISISIPSVEKVADITLSSDIFILLPAVNFF